MGKEESQLAERRTVLGRRLTRLQAHKVGDQELAGSET
jgi:hypothetical protein